MHSTEILLKGKIKLYHLYRVLFMQCAEPKKGAFFANLWQTCKTGHNPSKSDGRDNRAVNLAILAQGLNGRFKINSVPIVYQAVGLYKVRRVLLSEFADNA